MRARKMERCAKRKEQGITVTTLTIAFVWKSEFSQPGVDAWSLGMMQRRNSTSDDAGERTDVRFMFSSGHVRVLT